MCPLDPTQVSCLSTFSCCMIPVPHAGPCPFEAYHELPCMILSPTRAHTHSVLWPYCHPWTCYLAMFARHDAKNHLQRMAVRATYHDGEAGPSLSLHIDGGCTTYPHRGTSRQQRSYCVFVSQPKKKRVQLAAIHTYNHHSEK